MIIESRKTKLVHEVSIEDWNKMVSEGKKNLYKVLDKSPKAGNKQAIIVPEVIKDLNKTIKKPIKKDGRKRPSKKAPKNDA